LRGPTIRNLFPVGDSFLSIQSREIVALAKKKKKTPPIGLEMDFTQRPTEWILPRQKLKVAE